MMRQRTRVGRKNPIPGAPQATWRINMARAGHSIARRSVEFPEGDYGVRRTFVGIAFLVPELQEVWAVPALGNSDTEDRVLWHSLGTHRDCMDLAADFTETFGHPKFGKVQSTRLFGLQNIVRCDLPGCDKFGSWHDANREFEMQGDHKAQVTEGAGYRVGLVWDWRNRDWRVDTYLYVRTGPMNERVTASFISDLTWLQAEAKRLNSREAVAA